MPILHSVTIHGQCHLLNGFPNDSAPGGMVLLAETSSERTGATLRWTNR